MLRKLLLAALTLFALLPAAALAAPVPEGAVYSEHYIPSSSPVPNDEDPTLHADVLRPKDAAGKVPTVLTVSPYTNHSTQNGTDKDPEDPGVTRDGPSDRFFDFVEGAKLFENGYAYVMVDLRGFGGSGGCNDWGGPGEQNDVKRAVEWVAEQPWSNGKVALYGKSYDAWTGLMGLAQKPKGLAAVVAQEPVVDGYRYLYMNRMRFTNSVLTGGLFQIIDAHPGTVNDDPEYHGNNVWANVVKPGCYAQNSANQNNEDPSTDYWKARNLIDVVKGVETPTFFMQGFLESNTKPDAVFDFWNNLGGSEHRAWFGQWDHVRGYEKVGNEYATGRDTFIAEVMRFLDEHLKGVEPAVADPKITVQTSDGSFRSEERWPPADGTALTTTLKGGTYTDDGMNTGDNTIALHMPNAEPGNGIWSISEPLTTRAHLAGVPRLTVDVDTLPRANLVANVYDIDADNLATVVSRGGYQLQGSGPVTFDLYGQDWVFEPGHRIGVLLSTNNAEWFDAATPSGHDVTVNSASIQLPFLRYERPSNLSGKAGPAPSGYRDLDNVRTARFEVDADALTAGATAFALPPALIPRPVTGGSGGPVTAPVPGGGGLAVEATPSQERRPALGNRRARRGLLLKLRVKRLSRRRLLITGTATRGMRVTVRVLRRGRTVVRRQFVVRSGRFRLVVKLRRPGRHAVRATGKSGAQIVSSAPRRR